MSVLFCSAFHYIRNTSRSFKPGRRPGARCISDSWLSFWT